MRIRSQLTRDYTFLHQHNSWSRIDMCWASANLMQEVEGVDILPNTFADHNPLLIKIWTISKNRLFLKGRERDNHTYMVKIDGGACVMRKPCSCPPPFLTQKAILSCHAPSKTIVLGRSSSWTLLFMLVYTLIGLTSLRYLLFSPPPPIFWLSAAVWKQPNSCVGGIFPAGGLSPDPSISDRKSSNC